MPLLKSLAQQVLAELGVNSAQVQDDIVGEMCRWGGVGWDQGVGWGGVGCNGVEGWLGRGGWGTRGWDGVHGGWGGAMAGLVGVRWGGM